MTRQQRGILRRYGAIVVVFGWSNRITWRNCWNQVRGKAIAIGSGMRVIAKEINDFGDATCACCGRPHRKMHRMSDGTVRGSRCAETVERLTEGPESFRNHWVNVTRMNTPNSPALRFVKCVSDVR